MTKTETIRIKGIHFETNDPVEIEITNGIISSISNADDTGTKNSNLYVAPGLVDNQVNGYKGVDFSDENFSPEQMIKAAEAIWKDGVTSFVPTLITNSHDNLIRNFKLLAESLEFPMLRLSVPGFHLEGPYISSEEGFYGCHPVMHIRNPSWSEFAEYQKAANGNIIQITISPEIEGAIEFIKLCTQNGIIVSLGHTNASAEIINLAVRNGARLSTHLGNGCANMIHRHNNPLWPQLANDRLTPSVIADGHHLLHEEIQVFYKVKGPDNMILTSDVNHLIGMTPGKYIFLGSEVVYTDDGLVMNPKLNCLAGASLPLRKGVETMMNYTGCSLGEAIKMASGNVVHIYNLKDRGILAPGKRADIILFELNDNQLIIKKTFLSGELVYTAE